MAETEMTSLTDVIAMQQKVSNQSLVEMLYSLKKYHHTKFKLSMY